MAIEIRIVKGRMDVLRLLLVHMVDLWAQKRKQEESMQWEEGKALRYPEMN